LNKKSAQKQKRICNNRFSQAVVLFYSQFSLLSLSQRVDSAKERPFLANLTQLCKMTA